MKLHHCPASLKAWTAAAVYASLVCLTSCGDGRVPAYPVQGYVFYKGNPAEHAVVVFHYQGDSEALAGLTPNGRAGADGCFSLKTYVSGDGAPAGDYVVTIELPDDDPDVPADRDDPEYLPFGPDRLKGRYADPKSSSFGVSITKGDNLVGPFELE